MGYSPLFLQSERLKKQLKANQDGSDEDDSRLMARRSFLRIYKRSSNIGLGKNKIPGPSTATVKVAKVGVSRVISPLVTGTRALNSQGDVHDRSAGSPQSPVSANPPSRTLSQASLDEAQPMQNVPLEKDRETPVSTYEPAVEEIARIDVSQPSGKDGGQQHPPEKAMKRGELPKLSKVVTDEDTLKLPDLKTLITQLLEAGRQWDSPLFIVLDGWDEDNMINPEEFRILLDALWQGKCKIFLTSRSGQIWPDESGTQRMPLQAGREMAYQSVDIEPFIEQLLRDNPETERLPIEYENLPKQIAARSDGV